MWRAELFLQYAAAVRSIEYLRARQAQARPLRRLPSTAPSTTQGPVLPQKLISHCLLMDSAWACIHTGRCGVSERGLGDNAPCSLLLHLGSIWQLPPCLAAHLPTVRTCASTLARSSAASASS